MAVVVRIDVCKETAFGRVLAACIGQTFEFVQQLDVRNTLMPIVIKAAMKTAPIARKVTGGTGRQAASATYLSTPVLLSGYRPQ